MSITKAGQSITSLADWAQYAPPSDLWPFLDRISGRADLHVHDGKSPRVGTALTYAAARTRVHKAGYRDAPGEIHDCRSVVDPDGWTRSGSRA